MYEQRLAVLWVGLSGCHGDAINGASITYYDTRLRAYYGEVIEGGFIIDKREVLARKPGLSVSSPMCKGSMKPGTIDQLGDCSDSFIANAIANDPNNPMNGLAKLAIVAKGKFGGMDFVAPDLYAAWWLEKGAKVGTRIVDLILWSNGFSEIIPNFGDRYK